MDSTQFQQFLTLFNQSQQQLIARVVTAQSQDRNSQQGNQPQVNATFLPSFENFDAKKESFRYYRQRFENYLQMKGIALDKALCAKMLLNSIGATHYNTLAALVAPQTPNMLEYDNLVQVLEKHLCPKKNILVAQHRFLSTYQNENQPLAEYIALLRQDIADCEFISPCDCKVSITDIFLRAQFIRGIRDNTIREQLLQSDVSTFTEITEKALALEASKIDSRELSKSQPAMNSTNMEDVNKVIKQRKSRRDISTSRKGSSERSYSRQNYRPRFKSRIDYKRLGIEGLCLRCGKNNHLARDCRIKVSTLKCTACNKSGHLSKVCIRSLLKANQSNAEPTTGIINYIQNDMPTYGVNHIIDIFGNQHTERNNSKKFSVTVNIEGHSQTFEVDSGAGVTLLPRKEFEKLKLKINPQKSMIAFRSYTQDVFLPDGEIEVEVQYKDRKSREKLYIVPDNLTPLLGRTWIRHLGINLQEIDNEAKTGINHSQNQIINNIEDITNQFSDIFEEKIGRVPNVTISLQLRDKVKPIFHKEREVPYALRGKVDKELNDLEAAGIISKVNLSDWGSPLVVIPKADGGVRLCVDYKIGVNQRLVSANYPIRRIDEILNSLRGSHYFCRLDLFKAYLHLQVDERSSEIQTISTHRGTYRMNRLSFGIKTAPSEFNRIIDQILSGLNKTLAYFDDIIVHGSTKEECQQNLYACLQRLKEYDLHLNKSKCLFFKEEIEYLGHTIGFNKISKSPKKIEAIINMPRPSSIGDVRRFLGMVTYYSSFIPNASTITYPLRKLLVKDSKFKWNNACENAFLKLKNEISSDRILTPYEPELPLVITCDASPTGIAGVLSHIINGIEKPIAFASRSLTSAERNYSQLDREALAIVFAVNRFFMYVYGRKFNLITDNRPLTRIFHQNNKLPAMTSARLLRYASFLSGFDYEVEYKKGSENTNVDCLSRAPVDQKYYSTDIAINEEIYQICYSTIFEISTEELTAKTIAHETDRDEVLSKIKRKLLSEESDDIEYTLEAGILFKGQRVIIPKVLQPKILEELHKTHVGITKMKQLARRYCIWKGIDRDIEQMVKSCQNCAEIKTSPAKAPLHQWEEPISNWNRIHIDYAGPFENHYFLVVVDARSKWAEIRIIKEAPTSEKTIELLKGIFSTHGFPDVMVSDNATIFVSETFKQFCRENGIFQKFIAPGHPATNGLAERNIQTLKQRLKSMKDENLTLNQKVREILFRYRATPLACGKSPAELYLHRAIRIKLDALKPCKKIINYQKIPGTRNLQVGERVQARYYTNLKPIWKFGTVIKKLGQVHYLVKLDNGYIFKRHIDQLRSTGVKKKTVRFASDAKGGEEEVKPEEKLLTELGHYMEYSKPAPPAPPAPPTPPASVAIQIERPPGEPSINQPGILSTPRPRRQLRTTYKVPLYLKDYVLK